MKQLNHLFVISSVFLGLLLGCKPSEMSQTEVNKNVIRQFTEALNTANFDLMDELLKPDLVRHCQAAGDVLGRDDYKRSYQKLLTTFPDAHTANHFLIAESDMVAGFATLTATQMGPLGPFPATGKKITNNFLGIFRLEEGKIAELWVEWDNLVLLTQLGHFPPPEESEM